MPMLKRLLCCVSTIFFSLALLNACSAYALSANSQAIPTSSASSSSISATSHIDSPPPPINSLLRKDMAYADARKVLLAHGWKPEKDARCRANVGANESLCKESPDFAVCRACDDLPELSAYSDGGDAVTHFVHGEKQLTLRASGSISDWKVPGDNSRLSVTDWQISEQSP